METGVSIHRVAIGVTDAAAEKYYLRVCELNGGPVVSMSDDPAARRNAARIGGEPASTQQRDRTRTSLDNRLARPAPTVWLSGQEAAEYVGVSWPTLRRTLLEHGIPHLRLGTRWKIDVAVLDEHLHRLAKR